VRIGAESARWDVLPLTKLVWYEGCSPALVLSVLLAMTGFKENIWSREVFATTRLFAEEESNGRDSE